MGANCRNAIVQEEEVSCIFLNCLRNRFINLIAVSKRLSHILAKQAAILNPRYFDAVFQRQCTILRNQVEAVLKNPACSGVFLWQFADCRVTEEWAMHRPKTHNNKGVVDEYRRPKMSYAVVKELFQKQKG